MDETAIERIREKVRLECDILLSPEAVRGVLNAMREADADMKRAGAFKLAEHISSKAEVQTICSEVFGAMINAALSE